MSKTIAALSTASGGAISVIRVSGDDALEICDKVFKSVSSKSLCGSKGYTAHFGYIYNKGIKTDEAVALVFKAPNSYTGEDTAELSVHGGRVAESNCLTALYEAGAVPAKAGEFTKRAFLNGKLDLTEAESVLGIITATSQYDMKLQLSAKGGAISGAVKEIRDLLVSSAGDIAAYSDFPEEDIPNINADSIKSKLVSSADRIEKLIKTFSAGQVLHRGVRTAIAGKPNAGKSTLMNLLCGTERSIVTDIAGTTRDIIEQAVMCGDIPLVLYDTAGLHETDDTVERVGIRRAEECIDSAQLVLAVFDGSEDLTDADRALIKMLADKTAIAVVNKSDLESKNNDYSPLRAVTVSAKTGDGRAELEKAIAEVTGAAYLDPDSAVLATERQHDCAVSALNSLKEAISTIEKGFTLDAAGVYIDDAVDHILSLTGERVSDKVAEDVFSRFCIGK